MNKQKILEKLEELKKFVEGENTSVFEDHNFRVNSDGWKKITVKGESYLENPEKDIWEILEGDCKGEQLFTWDAAMRETEKAGKRMPTDEEFTELLKVREDMPNITYIGYRHTNGSFYDRGTYAYFWSSTESGACAWVRFLSSSFSTVGRATGGKAYGFSVRVLKN